VHEKGNRAGVGDTVTITYTNGGGSGGCLITKITDKGFRFTQGKGREKTVQYEALSELWIQHCGNRKSTGKKDISGEEVREGDIIECHIGGNVLFDNLVIKYGTYQAYCPVDKCYTDSVGFYASGKGLSDMPIGPLEDYAKVIGNIADNPELVDW